MASNGARGRALVRLADDTPRPSPDERARFARQLALPGFDEDALARLRAARVLLLGAGALGSACGPYLVASGVGTVGILDDDTVEASNLHRQLVHARDDVGRAKVDSMAEALAAVAPEARLRRHRERLTAENALGLFAEYDLVVDGTDNFPTRYLANDAAVLSGVPLLWGAVLRYGGQVGLSLPGRGPGYRDLFPAPPDETEVLDCASGGVLPGVCAVVGSLLSTEAVKLLTGIGEPLTGRVVVYDALAARFREVEYAADPDARPVTALPGGDAPDAARPDAPTESGPISADELRALLASGAPVRMIDVRERFEWDIAHLPGAFHVPLARLSAEDARGEGPVVVYCHHDPRSRTAAQALEDAGVPGVRWLAGGIDAYASAVDPSLPRY